MKPSSCSFPVYHFILLLLLISFSSPSSSSSIAPSPPQQQSTSSCMDYSFADPKHAFSFCNDLPVLNSFLHWNFDTSTRTVDIAYRHADVDASTWVAWAINPTSTHMIGSQAFVAFQGPDGTMRAYTSPVTSYRTRLEEGTLSFPVHDVSATFDDKQITIFATFQLPNDDNSTIVNQLWQDGPIINGEPGMHRTSGPNVRSSGTLDFLSGHTSKQKKGDEIPRLKLKNVHGVLNAVSWGTLMPLGAIIARYLKKVNSARPAWFYLHILCQTMAYFVGIGGWATGLFLRKMSSGVQYDAHKNIGIILFPLATLQVFALMLRPKPEHKYRCYWNFYHHMTGYAVIILSIINVFKGIEILDPDKKWKNIYIGVIVSLGAIAVVLEAISWYTVVMKRIRNNTDEKTEQAVVDDDRSAGSLSMV